MEIHCPGKPTFSARINGAYSECGTKGTLETVRKLTGLPINYLITVNFRGFRQLVDAVGGVWMDVDRRYFNDQGGDFGYATINLFPGYQKLGGYQALDYVRYRHTDSDLYRSRGSSCSCAPSRTRIKANTGPLEVPRIVKTITENVEVGQGGTRSSTSRRCTVRPLRLLATAGALLPVGSRGSRRRPASTSSCRRRTFGKAVQEFAHPDVESPQKATRVA